MWLKLAVPLVVIGSPLIAQVEAPNEPYLVYQNRHDAIAMALEKKDGSISFLWYSSLDHTYGEVFFLGEKVNDCLEIQLKWRDLNARYLFKNNELKIIPKTS